MDYSKAGMKIRKRKPKTKVIDDCMTCSVCQSKLVKISDITRVSLDYIQPTNSVNTLSCSSCGSTLRLLNDFVH
ncbi:zn-finger protein-like protein [Yokapox virus]|uniref:Zn-finger protein-like protein n=1 Tax=Yokapox virus TaxID=1076255 RepID=G3EI15_9POXV|nr:zn-finger protein-like protein [Yokapox virus]AEN03712.1 zn-finger protein-like protein [Yokapox virus]